MCRLKHRRRRRRPFAPRRGKEAGAPPFPRSIQGGMLGAGSAGVTRHVHNPLRSRARWPWQRWKCAPCPHLRQRRRCKECGSVGTCPHQRLRSACKEGGGAIICPRKRISSQCKGEPLPEPAPRVPMQRSCKECGGTCIRPHQRIRSPCKECGGASTSANGANAGVRRGERLPAPAPKEPLKEVREGGHLPARAPKEPLQGVRAGFRRHL
jgi:hypothetical protein